MLLVEGGRAAREISKAVINNNFAVVNFFFVCVRAYNSFHPHYHRQLVLDLRQVHRNNRAGSGGRLMHLPIRFIVLLFCMTDIIILNPH